MATKTRSSAARKPSTGGGSSSHKAKAAANPFKKTADAMRSTQKATAEASEDAFAYGKQFAQHAKNNSKKATQQAFSFGQQMPGADWMTKGTEAMQNMFSQAMQGMPSMPNMPSMPSMPSMGAGAAAFNPSQFGMDGAQLNRAADVANKSVSEIMSLSTENLQAMNETGTAVANMAKDMSQEVVQAANTLFTDHVELSKALLSCRNVDDMMELQSKASQAALENFFQESVRISELAFKYASELAEPIQQRMTHAGERLSKLVTAA